MKYGGNNSETQSPLRFTSCHTPEYEERERIKSIIRVMVHRQRKYTAGAKIDRQKSVLRSVARVQSEGDR